MANALNSSCNVWSQWDAEELVYENQLMRLRHPTTFRRRTTNWTSKCSPHPSQRKFRKDLVIIDLLSEALSVGTHPSSGRAGSFAQNCNHFVCVGSGCQQKRLDERHRRLARIKLFCNEAICHDVRRLSDCCVAAWSCLIRKSRCVAIYAQTRHLSADSLANVCEQHCITCS